MAHSTSLGALLSVAVLTFLQFKGMTVIKRELQIEVEIKLYFTANMNLNLEDGFLVQGLNFLEGVKMALSKD